MVKDHSDSEKGNPLLPHRLLLPFLKTKTTPRISGVESQAPGGGRPAEEKVEVVRREPGTAGQECAHHTGERQNHPPAQGKSGRTADRGESVVPHPYSDPDK